MTTRRNARISLNTCEIMIQSQPRHLNVGFILSLSSIHALHQPDPAAHAANGKRREPNLGLPTKDLVTYLNITGRNPLHCLLRICHNRILPSSSHSLEWPVSLAKRALMQANLYPKQSGAAVSRLKCCVSGRLSWPPRPIIRNRLFDRVSLLRSIPWLGSSFAYLKMTVIPAI